MHRRDMYDSILFSILIKNIFLIWQQKLTPVSEANTFEISYDKGPSINDVHSQGGCGVCPVRTRGKGLLQMRISTLLEQKTLDFSKFLMCLHGQEREGVEPVRTRGGGGQFFASLCGWTAPNPMI